MIEKQYGRIGWIDAAKCIAMFAIVLGHTLRTGAVHNYLYSFHVPTFFLLSGYCLSERDDGYMRFLMRKIKNLLVPYYIFGFISILIFMVLGNYVQGAIDLGEDIESGFFKCVEGLLFASCKTGYMRFNLPLWFIPCLFTLENAFYGIRNILRRFSVTVQTVICAAIIVVTGVLGWLNITNDLFTCLPYEMDTAFNMLPFYTVGYLLKLHSDKWQRLITAPVPVRIPASVCLIAVGFFISSFNGMIGYVADTYNNWLLFYSAGIIGAIGWLILSSLFEHCRPILYVGRSTIVILLLHKFPILFFQTVVPFTSAILADCETVKATFIAVAVALITMLFCVVASYIINRWFPFLLGKWYPKKKIAE